MTHAQYNTLDVLRCDTLRCGASCRSAARHRNAYSVNIPLGTAPHCCMQQCN